MIFESTGLTLIAYTPELILASPGGNIAYDPTGGGIWLTLTKIINSYAHVISTGGGFMSAAFSMSMAQDDADEFFTSGLGKHIELRDAANIISWEGFINSISMTVGGLSVTIGPLIGLVNRVSCTYSVLDLTVDPPVSGITTTTLISDNDNSKRRFGILESVFGLGQTTTAIANNIRDKQLLNLAWPRPGQTINFGSAASQINISVECLGYMHFLDRAIYNNPTATSTITISSTATSKVQRVLGGATGATAPNANPNGLFSVNNSDIDSVASLVGAYENSNRTGLQIIKEMAAAGDGTNDYPIFFGVYANRKFRYKVMSTDLAQKTLLSDQKQRISKYDGGEIRPWNVEVGLWLLITDFLTYDYQKLSGTEVWENPRNLLGQSLTYTAPWGLSINGGQVQTIEQMLNYYGLVGLA